MDRERDLPLRRPGGRDRRPEDQGPDDQPGDQPSDQDDEDAERSRPAGLHGGEHTPLAPAAARAALMFSPTWRSWARMSPAPTTSLPGPRASWPDTKIVFLPSTTT